VTVANLLDMQRRAIETGTRAEIIKKLAEKAKIEVDYEFEENGFQNRQ
jgi:hypothetical protein